MNSKVYKSCTVPLCKNTSIKTPNKVFVYIPHDKIVRDKWLKLARRNPNEVVIKSRLYFCEDDFDLPNDMENYMQYHIMGSVSQVRMNPGCVPTKFNCQRDRRKRTFDATERSYTAQKRRRVALQENYKYFKEKSVTQTQQSTFKEIASGSPDIYEEIIEVDQDIYLVEQDIKEEIIEVDQVINEGDQDIMYLEDQDILLEEQDIKEEIIEADQVINEEDQNINLEGQDIKKEIIEEDQDIKEEIIEEEIINERDQDIHLEDQNINLEGQDIKKEIIEEDQDIKEEIIEEEIINERDQDIHLEDQDIHLDNQDIYLEHHDLKEEIIEVDQVIKEGDQDHLKDQDIHLEEHDIKEEIIEEKDQNPGFEKNIGDICPLVDSFAVAEFFALNAYTREAIAAMRKEHIDEETLSATITSRTATSCTVLVNCHCHQVTCHLRDRSVPRLTCSCKRPCCAHVVASLMYLHRVSYAGEVFYTLANAKHLNTCEK